MWIAVAAASAQEALELFANEPFTFALKPIVRRVLLGIASESASVKQVDLAVKTTFIYMHTCIWVLLFTPHAELSSLQRSFKVTFLNLSCGMQPDDKAFFRELEAVYLLRLLLISCVSSLETCAYELQDSSAVLTARLQSKHNNVLLASQSTNAC